MKLRLIYYKDIVDMALKAFISQNKDFFTKSDGKYVFGKSGAQSKLKAEFEDGIVAAIRYLIESRIKSDNDKLVVIGSCFPPENMIMQFKDESYFPKKLNDVMREKPYVKWTLKEYDIAVDMNAVNWQLSEIFNEMFAGDSRVYKSLKKYGVVKNDIICVAHKSLDSYAIFKVIKWIYGGSNCMNVHAEKLGDYTPCLIDMNELASKYVHRKNEMNKSHFFKKCALEIKEYLAKKLEI